MNIRVEGDSKIFGPSNHIWQGRLGTGSIRVKLEMSVRHFMARRVGSWIFRCGGSLWMALKAEGLKGPI